MLTKHPISKIKSYSMIASLVISILLLASCNLPSSLPPTAIPPSPTLLATSIPPSLTPPEAQATQTATPLPTASATPGATNIVFATGTTAAVEQGTVQPGQVLVFTLNATQSQPMVLILDSPQNDVTLGVFEPNGNKLLDPANKWNRWQWLLPKTELYTIQVIGGATAENYTLTAKVAQLVNFASGATTITLNGKTVNGYIFSYALSCQANQTMTATLSVSSSSAYIDIFGIATGVLLSASTKANTWTGVLPATQEYVIEVIPNNGQVVNYSLTVSVH